jgi:polar amino acid transport system substrate-binding protein
MKKSQHVFFNVHRIVQSVLIGVLLSTSMVTHAATSTMEQIKQTKQLRIGVAPGDPWYYKDPATGLWTGVGVMVGEQLAKDLGVKLVTVETTYGNAVAGLQANQMDVMLVLDATDERKKALDFPSNPLLWYKQGVLIRQGVAAKTWDDLNNPNVRIGVSLGTATDRDLTKRLPNAHIERFANTDEAVAAFMAGRVDGISFYHPALVIAYSHIHKGTVVIPLPVVALPTSAGIRKESDPAFKDFLNNEFAKYYNDGTVQRFYAEYLKTKGVDPSQVPTVMERDTK